MKTSTRWTATTAVSLLAAGTMVWGASNAAFTGQTSNDANAWTSGYLALTNDRNGVAMFEVDDMAPGDQETRCIEVTYTGSAPALIVLYGRQATDPDDRELYPHLQVTMGDVGPECDTWNGTTYNGSQLTTRLDSFTGATSYDQGQAPVVMNPGDTVGFGFTVTLVGSTPDTAMGRAGVFDFIWEARTI